MFESQEPVTVTVTESFAGGIKVQNFKLGEFTGLSTGAYSNQMNPDKVINLCVLRRSYTMIETRSVKCKHCWICRQSTGDLSHSRQVTSRAWKRPEPERGVDYHSFIPVKLVQTLYYL